MPFWWRRRRKPWFGRWRRRTRKRRYPQRRKRKFYKRRRYRTTSRRRRRRKVRRKKKKIPIQQWQPESIHKCKIVGFSNLVLGAEGCQYLCWTNEQPEYTQPKAPGGGGFGSEVITLEWLYKEWRAHNNIWTKSNKNKDLVRYTGCQIILYRHATTDFVFTYNRSPPFDITKFTYPDCQPQNILLRPHKRIIPSLLTKPWGKKYVKIKIKPPTQMITKWFFQANFADVGLVLLQASAANFRFPSIGPKAQNQMVTIYFLDLDLYNIPNWGQTRTDAWRPQSTHQKWIFSYKTKTGETKTVTMPPLHVVPPYDTLYATSISRDNGWWQKAILNAISIQRDGVAVANKPIYTARYNPNMDTGEGNIVYAVSILQSKWTPPTYQTEYEIVGQPLWMAFFGFFSFLKHISRDKAFDLHYMFVIKSPAIIPVTVTKQDFYAFVDWDFINGQLPYEEYISDKVKAAWYPKATFQTVTINALVESGPFIPRYSNIPESTWELMYKYKFFFKWGGPQAPDEPVDDPKGKHTYPVPDTMHTTIQIGDPKKQTTESILHHWDFRRGIVTQTALKRMQENIQTDTDFQSDDSETPRKKRRLTKEMPYKDKEKETLQACLQDLCKESTCQETPQTIQQLIEQQQQQQRDLKHNLLQLLTHLKKQQRFLGLQTGLIE
nr:MAG: ORF1 [Torque teno midi virus]